jgi:hypothetical protein
MPVREMVRSDALLTKKKKRENSHSASKNSKNEKGKIILHSFHFSCR